jgi:hypothetical protein
MNRAARYLDERILPAIRINTGSRQNHGWQNHFSEAPACEREIIYHPLANSLEGPRGEVFWTGLQDEQDVKTERWKTATGGRTDSSSEK